MASNIVSFSWSEPEPGRHAEVWDLSPAEWRQVAEAIDWVSFYWESMGKGVGGKISLAEIHRTRATGGDRTDIVDALRMLADSVRYSTGEGLYERDCPIFARHGIARS
ncbi:uncharacterized protein SOCEGT47_056810 [Sorangium cellulosum]|uniref:Uncharacterized protein n=1 Tax=Sorangium cellulosum TaxID=56 RepID=A0A4P2Q6M1_SORCE|nr:hypothetical protein [Sorangium cellulosum]AUX25137.1 uncharacterized protein SOCEGT47_056810 [Sorangium cellulosum]